MLFELRTYTVAHGKMDDYLARYEQHALPILKRHLGRLVGCYLSEIGPLNQVLHIWGYESLADRERRRAALESDVEWIAFKLTNSGTFVQQEVRIMRPARFSPPIS